MSDADRCPTRDRRVRLDAWPRASLRQPPCPPQKRRKLPATWPRHRSSRDRSNRPGRARPMPRPPAERRRSAGTKTRAMATASPRRHERPPDRLLAPIARSGRLARRKEAVYGPGHPTAQHRNADRRKKEHCRDDAQHTRQGGETVGGQKGGQEQRRPPGEQEQRHRPAPVPKQCNDAKQG